MNTILSLEALKVLDAIDRHGSFAAAAEALCKVPSSLSYTIKKLEEELGATLFDRSQHKSQLTDVGQFVLKQGREILHASDKLFESVKQLESGWETELRIVRDTVIEESLLLPIFRKFETLDKQVDLSLSVEVLGGAWDALYTDRADIVIGASGEAPDCDFDTHKIGELDTVFVVAPDHPLAGLNRKLKREDLLPFPSVVVSDSSHTLPKRNSGLFTSRRAIHVNTMESKLQFQLAGLGVGFVPTHLAKPYIQSGKLVVKACEVAKPRVDMYIAWHRNTQGRAMQWFIEQLCRQQWF